MGPWHPSENTLFFCTNATGKIFFLDFCHMGGGGGVGVGGGPLRVTRTGLMNKVTPSQPERDPIGQTPKEKEACSMAKGKK